MTSRLEEIGAFLDTAGWADADRVQIAGDASARRYFRLSRADGGTAILMDAPREKGEDVEPFVKVAAHLRGIGLSAPEIYAQDSGSGLLLLEDFGDALFADLMAGDPAQEIPLYRAAAEVLSHVHRAPNPELPRCSTEWLVEMIDPVFEWYAAETAETDVRQFRDYFLPLASKVAEAAPVMILRDFHAQNLLLLPDREGVRRVGLLDFQDALLGHPAYDLVSILQDARRDVIRETENEILSYFLERTGHTRDGFLADYAVLGLQRNLRILGIFARLGLRDGKRGYIDLIPRVWRYVSRNLSHPTLTGVADVLRQILPTPTDDFLAKMKARCPTDPSQP